MSLRSIKELAIELDRLKSFSKRSIKLEQYPTPANIAAEWLWGMAVKQEIQDKVILDAGCGNGILGLGCLLLGAKKVYFLDIDKDVINITKENYKILAREYELGKVQFINEDISDFNKKVDLVIQNPPFGTKQEHADKIFLEKAFSIAKIIYSMHKSSTKKFIEAISKDSGFKITESWDYAFPIKAEFKFHSKLIKKIEVTVWRMEKVEYYKQ